MSLTIRPYTPDDFSAVVELSIQLQDYAARVDQLSRYRLKEEFDATTYTQRVLQENPIVFVAQDDEHIVGCIMGRIETPEGIDAMEVRNAERRGHIKDLVVDTKAQGKGLGTQLLGAMEDYFTSQDCTLMELGCLTDNTNAHQFYIRAGFVDHVVLMVKPL